MHGIWDTEYAMRVARYGIRDPKFTARIPELASRFWHHRGSAIGLCGAVHSVARQAGLKVKDDLDIEVPKGTASVNVIAETLGKIQTLL